MHASRAKYRREIALQRLVRNCAGHGLSVGRDTDQACGHQLFSIFYSKLVTDLRNLLFREPVESTRVL